MYCSRWYFARLALGLVVIALTAFGCDDEPTNNGDGDASDAQDTVDVVDDQVPVPDYQLDIGDVSSDIEDSSDLDAVLDQDDTAELLDAFDAFDVDIPDGISDVTPDSPLDPDTLLIEVLCSDGEDNDGDRDEDCLDIDCDGVDHCEFGLEVSCGDGEDNDGDGGTDCEDPECANCGGACCGQGWYCEDEQCKISCTEGEQCGIASDICCPPSEICFLSRCASPGDACATDDDCDVTEYCEPTIGSCLPLSALPLCEVHPTSNFDPAVEWSWTGSTTYPDYKMVVAAPIVINMTDDNADGAIDTDDVPDILFSTYANGQYTGPGYIRVLSGDTGAELMTFDTPCMGSATLAAGDLDRDGRPEVVAPSANAAKLLVFENDGTVKHEISGLVIDNNRYGGASLADLNGDGWPEIVIGLQVFDPVAGTLLWDGLGQGCGLATNAGYASFSVAWDMDLASDGHLELVTNNCVFASTGNLLYTGAAPGGFIGIGEFDDDAYPEVVIVSDGSVHIWEHDFSSEKWSVAIPGGGRGGPPVISNFDADDELEIGVAGDTVYFVVENVIDPSGGAESPSIIWQSTTQDEGSGMTGSSVFDFEGDGIAEVVYNDECFLRIYNTTVPGTDPTSVRWSMSNTSSTLFEYPLVADVDNDGNAELVVIRNTGSNRAAVCAANWANFDITEGNGDGIRVFGDRNDNWVPTRRIWNQHTYHITNVLEDGRIPPAEEPNGDRFDNFRQNEVKRGVFNAPDLETSNFDVDGTGCPGALALSVNVCNVGARGVPAELPVSFYLVEESTPEFLDVGFTAARLLPGDCERVSISWDIPIALQGTGPHDLEAVADDAGDGDSTHSECDETNNNVEMSATCGE